ncbi:hypothetical protein I5677_08065 [Mobilitalea sibirica]|uniref:Uncharacterized protein n=1 Tax=Mobilitalea sibirica TaxID=1462919 RepID=A0A8J7HB93_9FIRM|nr:hypothetical protein [Mobilitalea sibirica]MBH1940841.1 hypothetical protein [Mobilitalea sibirica]
MKKVLSVILCSTLIMTLLTACGSKETGSNNTAVKTGLAVITEASKSKDAGEADGLAQANSTAVAVLVDSKGVIKKCAIDVIQPKINFSIAGEITTDMATVFVSKEELGDAYGMKKASGIGKEWNEQAAALAEYVTGKTVEDLKGIALDEEGHPTEADLTSSVTMSIGEIIDAVEKAVANAEELGASANDKLGLGLVSNLGKSKNASAEGDGTAQAYTHYGVITLDKDGKITSSIIDASQANIKFSADGKITSDIAGEFKTKLELGDAYNMKGNSGIGKEWYEQAKAFADYIKGKTVTEVTGIALDEEDVPTDKDLVSSVTIGIADFLTVVEKAGAVAK